MVRMALLPHPVIITGGDDYKNGSFGFVVDDKKRTIDDKVKISGHMTLESKFMKKLLENEKGRFITMITCTRTYKRTIQQHWGGGGSKKWKSNYPCKSTPMTS